MNEKEVGEIRRRVRADRTNMGAIYGCFVNEQKQIVTEYKKSVGIMSQNEGERYFGLMKRALSGTLGKNLVDIVFRTAQVTGGAEHQFLMALRDSQLKDDSLREQLYKKIIETVSMDCGYLILLGCDTYDVPFKSKDDELQSDNSSEVYRYLLCAVCPVKQTKANLHYVPEEKEFLDGGITQVASAPVLGFLFPAFDGRATNIYNALMYTKDTADGHEAFVEAMFNTRPVTPAAEQKKSFESVLTIALADECSMEVVQTVHEQLRTAIDLHKESRVADPLLIDREQVGQALKTCGVSETGLAKFNVQFDAAFGDEAQLHPKNLIDNKKFEIHTPDVSIKVAPDRADLIETRVLGGVKYILICADEDVEVNGVRINIESNAPEA